MARTKQNICKCGGAHMHNARRKYKLKPVESLDKMLARIRKCLNKWDSEFELKYEMGLLENTHSREVDLQMKNAAKFLKQSDELQDLRAVLQKKYSIFLGLGERMNWANLTEDLQIEILIRLPRKSLMRFKSVQRSWNILFKTPSFVNKRLLHNFEKGHAWNESINCRRYLNRSRYPKRRCVTKSKKLVAKMSHDDVLAEIQSGMNNAKCAYDLKTEIRFLEDMLICKADLQKELAAKHEKKNAEFQKLRAALQKRIDEVRKQKAENSKEA